MRTRTADRLWWVKLIPPDTQHPRRSLTIRRLLSWPTVELKAKVDAESIGKQQLRFDGLYVAQHPTNPSLPTLSETVCRWRVRWALSSGSPQKVATWLSRIHTQSHRGPWRVNDGLIEIRLHQPGVEYQNPWGQDSSTMTLEGTVHTEWLQLILSKPDRQPSREISYEFQQLEVGL